MKVDIELHTSKLLNPKILIDGVQCQRVRSLEFNASVGEYPTLTLEIIPDEINFSGDPEVIKELQEVSEEKNIEFNKKNEIVINCRTKNLDRAKKELKELEEITNRILEKQKLISSYNKS